MRERLTPSINLVYGLCENSDENSYVQQFFSNNTTLATLTKPILPDAM